MNELDKTVSAAESHSQPQAAAKDTTGGRSPESPAGPASHGVELLLNITSSNSQRLSDQVNSKAQILITVNSIIISVLLATVIHRLDTNNNLTLPTLLLLTVSLATIVLSISATRPQVAKGTFHMQDVAAGRVNLLFFGNFYRMPFDDYARGMEQLMQTQDAIYQALLRDVYTQGVVLGRKYRRLTMAYNVFAIGLIVSVITFFVAGRFFAS